MPLVDLDRLPQPPHRSLESPLLSQAPPLPLPGDPAKPALDRRHDLLEARDVALALVLDLPGPLHLPARLVPHHLSLGHERVRLDLHPLDPRHLHRRPPRLGPERPVHARLGVAHDQHQRVVLVELSGVLGAGGKAPAELGLERVELGPLFRLGEAAEVGDEGLVGLEGVVVHDGWGRQRVGGHAGQGRMWFWRMLAWSYHGKPTCGT